MIRDHLDHLLTPSHPLTNKEDRRIIWGWIIVAVILLMVVFSWPAHAAPDDGGSMYRGELAERGASGGQSRVRVAREPRQRRNKVAREPRQRRATAAAPGRERHSAVIIPHPPGCPSRLFCGCGASWDIFGKPIRSLWSSTAWFKFPRSLPAPNRVAVKRGHVFVLKQHVQGKVWMVNDYNSGGRKSRYHARSIAGYVIVDPRTRFAQARGE